MELQNRSPIHVPDQENPYHYCTFHTAKLVPCSRTVPLYDAAVMKSIGVLGALAAFRSSVVVSCTTEYTEPP